MNTKPPSFTIKRHCSAGSIDPAGPASGHYDLVSQDGSILVCGFDTIEQASDLIAKTLASVIAANVKKQGTLADVLKMATSGPKS